MANIPEGYELLAGRSRENARKALDAAEEKGLDPATVLTHPEGYLIPLAEGEVSGFDVDTAKVPALDAYINDNGLDVDLSLNKADKVAAIKAATAQNEEE